MTEILDDIIAYLRLGRGPVSRTQSTQAWADYLATEVRPLLDELAMVPEKRGPGRPRKTEAQS